MKKVSFFIVSALTLSFLFSNNYVDANVKNVFQEIIVPADEIIQNEKDLLIDFQEQYNLALEFRKKNGFDTSPEAMNFSLSGIFETELEKVLGFSLTKEEIALLEERERLIEQIPSIEEKVKSTLKNDYAGMYYDEKTGILYIYTSKFKNKYLELEQENVILEKVKFSLKDLEKQQKKLLELDKKQNIIMSYIDFKRNKVIVKSTDVKNIIGLSKESIELEEEIFEINEIKEDAVKLLRKDLPSGVRITNSNGARCSTGFNAVNASGQNVMVTAGHCEPWNHGNNWFEPSSSMWTNNLIGRWAAKNTGDLINSDSGFIRLENDVNPYPMIKDSSLSDIRITSFRTTLETQGITLFKQGYRTGRTSGTFHSHVCFNNYPDPQMSRVCEQGLISNMHANHGDSGGTIYRLKPDGTAELVGILGGEVETSSGNYIFYSRLAPIVNDLNLTGVYRFN